MPRANRHHLPGSIWHITHRCHKQEFLLKFDKDKKNWLKWLFEAKKRFGLSILNYCVTSNHIHLLVQEGIEEVIPKSIQLIAGKLGREYNTRKNRKGAFWEDRYHATAVKTGDHLVQCLIYIDLNMVRAGVVQHPSQWIFGGYKEIQNPKQRYSLIDMERLVDLLGMKNRNQLSKSHSKWVGELLKSGFNKRDRKWSEAIAVGNKDFVLETKAKLSAEATGRKAIEYDGGYIPKESENPYNDVLPLETFTLRQKNAYLWDIY